VVGYSESGAGFPHRNRISRRRLALSSVPNVATKSIITVGWSGRRLADSRVLLRCLLSLSSLASAQSATGVDKGRAWPLVDENLAKEGGGDGTVSGKSFEN
jgi:hypothetical protein